jgi:glycerate kinase
VAADVSAPLLGADGAVDLYSAQKGADADTRKALRDGLARWSTLVSPLLATSAGAGAGGGIGFAASSVLGAEVVSGAQLVLGLIGFHEALGASSAVVTGEGKLDTQTLQGKGPWEVVNLCQGAGVPSTFICGTSSLETVPAAPGLHILRMDKHDDHHVDSMTDPEGALRRLVRNNVDTVSGARR